jgi:hypothetical protein
MSVAGAHTIIKLVNTEMSVKRTEAGKLSYSLMIWCDE